MLSKLLRLSDGEGDDYDWDDTSASEQENMPGDDGKDR